MAPIFLFVIDMANEIKLEPFFTVYMYYYIAYTQIRQNKKLCLLNFAP